MKRGLNVRQTCGALSFYQRKWHICYMNIELVTLRITINKILFLTTKNSKSLFKLDAYLLLNNVCQIDKTIQSVVVFNKNILLVANLKNVI